MMIRPLLEGEHIKGAENEEYRVLHFDCSVSGFRAGL